LGEGEQKGKVAVNSLLLYKKKNSSANQKAVKSATKLTELLSSLDALPGGRNLEEDATLDINTNL